MSELENELLTARETAAVLRISLGTLGKWRRSGKGPRCVRLGYNKVVYARSAVNEWLSGKGM